MPIKNFTDNVQPRFPRIGRLRKGGEKTANGVGPDLDHWRFTSEQEDVEAAFYGAYGEQPRNVQVYLPHATPGEAFTTWCEIWGASGLTHRCDGENMSLWLEKDKYQRGEKPCPGGHKDNDPLNDAVGRLDVIVPELIEAGYVGYVTMETHSKNDILHILAILEKVYESRAGNSLGLRGIQFNLRRVKESISTPGWGDRKGQRSKTDKWLVKIEPSPDWVRLQMEMAHADQMMLEPGQATALLPSGEEADVITGEIFDPAPAKGNGNKPVPAPAGNGDKPAAQKNSEKVPLAQLNSLGNRLWPGGKWSEVSVPILQSVENDIGRALIALQGREKKIKDLDELTQHVAKAWPSYEVLIPLLVKQIGKDFDRFAALEGIAKAEETAQPGWGNEQFLAIVMAALAAKELTQ